MRDSLLESNDKSADRKARKNNAEGGVRRTARRTKLRQRLFGICRRNPGRVVFTSAVVAIFGVVFVNATYLQSERHPAPFFAKKILPVAPTTRSAGSFSNKLPLPVPRPAGLAFDAQPGAIQRVSTTSRRSMPHIEDPSPVIVSKASLPVNEHMTRPGPARDLIGSLIRDGDSAPRPPGRIPDRDLANKKESSSIRAAQKALAKLGFELTVDGITGPATRLAIEKFQRNFRIPVTGRLEGKTQRLLAARSGIRIP